MLVVLKLYRQGNGMYCVTTVFLILCAIPLIKAVGLKIDGLLNLGDTWSYEYRILRTDSSDSPHLRVEEGVQDKAKEVPQQKNEEVPRQIDVEAVFNKEKEKVLKREEIARDKEKYNTGESHEETARDKEKEIAGQKDVESARDDEKELARQRDEEIAHHKDKLARQKDEEAARIQRDEEHLSLAERVLRKEADRLRKEAQSPKLDQRQGQDKGGQIHYIHNTKKPKTVGTTETRTSKLSKQNIETIATSEDSSKSDESDDSDDTKKGTIMINDEATENPKKLLRDATDYSDSKSISYPRYDESFYSSESSISYRDKILQGFLKPEADTSTSSEESGLDIMKIYNYITPKYYNEYINKTLLVMVNKNKLQGKNKTGPLTTMNVTTVRTGEIFTNAHKVKDELDIIDFNTYVLNKSMEVFSHMIDTLEQEYLKNYLGKLMKIYRDKFLEFNSITKGQTIKTRLGTQKVILNTIDTSTRLLRRLMNIMVSDLDKKGILRHNAGTANRFQKAIELEYKLLSFYACRKFGVCRSGPGFSSFLVDIMTILLKFNDIKFKQSIDSFTEVIKYMQFYYILEPDTEVKLKAAIDRIERENIIMIRAIIMVLKSTITSQNKPMIVSHYIKRRSIVNSTLAFLEVIDLLDTKIPRNRTNVIRWADMKLSLEDFAVDKRTDIQEIMATIIRHVTTNLRGLDKNNKKIVSKNLDIILSLAARSDYD